ncbi:MAG: hypothetical protein CL608_09080 [Anaerolineaceae bacterium]|nr:hypothetical protein [Anaerolineaceae bacterium]
MLMDEVPQTSRWKFALFVSVIAVVVTAVCTYPLIFNWQTHVPGFKFADSFNHAWFAWWFDFAIFKLEQSPAELTYLFHPIYVEHPLLTAMAWSRFMPMLAIHFGSSLTATYNAHIFISYVLTWLFSSLLILELTNHKATAIVAGAIFAFFPNRTMHVLYGHYTQQITYQYPLLVWMLWRVWQRPSWQRGIWLGVALTLAAIVDLMPLAYFAAPVTLLLLLYFFFSDRQRFLSRPMLIALGTAFGIAALVVIPLIWPLFNTAIQDDLTWYQSGGVAEFSADGLALFVPPPGHILTRASQQLYTFSDNIHNWGYSASEAQVYAGWITLVLASIGLWRERHRTLSVGFWFLIALATAILALGPILRLGGQIQLWAGDRYIFLPYFLATKIPFLEWGRTPARLHFTTMFALMILAGYGLRYVLTRWKRPLAQAVVATAVLALILVDSTFQTSWPLLSTEIPPYMSEIAADSRAVAVLDIPVNNYRGEKYYMLYQTVHQHPIVGGHAYRTPQEIVDLRQEIVTDLTTQETISTLIQNNIGYVVLHHTIEDEAGIIQPITSVLQAEIGQPEYQDELITIFFIPNTEETE